MNDRVDIVVGEITWCFNNTNTAKESLKRRKDTQIPNRKANTKSRGKSSA